MSSGRTHRPQHDATRCMTCGGCTWQCPATVFPSLRSEEGSLRGEIYRSREFPGEMAARPPCVMACPLGQDVPGYISAIARSDVDEAATIVRRTNALPSVCGRVCSGDGVAVAIGCRHGQAVRHGTGSDGLALVRRAGRACRGVVGSGSGGPAAGDRPVGGVRGAAA